MSNILKKRVGCFFFFPTFFLLILFSMGPFYYLYIFWSLYILSFVIRNITDCCQALAGFGGCVCVCVCVCVCDGDGDGFSFSSQNYASIRVNGMQTLAMRQHANPSSRGVEHSILNSQFCVLIGLPSDTNILLYLYFYWN